MESACSLSSTHRIVLFGLILPPGDRFPRLAGAMASTEFFYGWVFLTWVRELYGIPGAEASNRNANRWKTLWRTLIQASLVAAKRGKRTVCCIRSSEKIFY
jgi:hypothetical protein